MLDSSFSPWPSFTEDEADAVRNVLLSNKVNYWTGQEGREFEREFASWADSQYAVAVANGTVALDLALKAFSIKAGDEVVVTPRTFIASVSCVVNAGATPIFAEVDRASGNITAETISRVITSRTKAVICVHLAGWPCDMEPIMRLASEHGFYVIEDCAQAHGAEYNGVSVGSIGHIGAWSFCQDKIMTTGGEGGMVTTNDEKIWRRMWSYKDHGKSYKAVYEREHKPGFRWLHETFGTNWRMTEMQAVIGRLQLGKMDAWHADRTKNAQNILDTCDLFPGSLRVPVMPNTIVHAWYKCYIYVRQEGLKKGWTRDKIVEQIGSHGVPCFSGSCSEVYLEKAFEAADLQPAERLKMAKEMGETSLMFLVHPTLKQAEIDETCRAIKEVMNKASV